jgi:hypothetical protein
VVEAEARPLRLGIAITTYNRRAMLQAQIETLHRLTTCTFDLVVCDDGSADDTVAAMAARGIPTIGGVNRGIAWNKNRGLFYLREIRGCEVILLLDDDVLPGHEGWERGWIEAVRRHGHINYMYAGPEILSGANTPEDPGVSHRLLGACIGFSRAVLGYVGYMDTRFKGYGHEHTELTRRAIRAGFGGYIQVTDGTIERRFYSIDGGLLLQSAVSHANPDSIAANERILDNSDNEPIYRHAWRNEEEYELLRAEMSPLDGLAALATVLPRDVAETGNLAQRRPALQSSRGPAARGATPAQDAAGAVNGRPDGRAKFHTAIERDPWWQVDLGAATRIAEIRIFNTMDPKLRDQFRRFRIEIGFDHASWVDVFTTETDLDVGGIDGNPFIWRPELSAWGRFVRITALGETALHLDQVEVYGPAGAQDARLSDQDLFLNFVSLGDNCEFGLIQRAVGIEPLDLLRFGGTGRDEQGLILGLSENFARFFTPYDLQIADHGGEWVSSIPAYEISFHTDRPTSEIGYAAMMEEERRRLGFLANRLIRDLAAAEKIFVRKSNKPVTDATMLAMFRAMRNYGAPVLLWVTAGTGDPAAQVERLAPGLLRGHLPRFAPYENAADGSVADWRELCRAALQLR